MSKDIVPYKSIPPNNDHITAHLLSLMGHNLIGPDIYAELERRFCVGNKVLRLRVDGREDLKDKDMVAGLHSVHAEVYNLSKAEALELFAFLYSRLHYGEYYECHVHNSYFKDMLDLGFGNIFFGREQQRVNEKPYCSMERLYQAYLEFLQQQPSTFKSPFYEGSDSFDKAFIGSLETLLKLRNMEIGDHGIICRVRRYSEKLRSGIHYSKGYIPLFMASRLGPGGEIMDPGGRKDHHGVEVNQRVSLEDIIMMCNTLFEGLEAIQMPREQRYIEKQIEQTEKTSYAWAKQEDMPRNDIDDALRTFGLDKTASFSEVKEKFRKMAVEYIPEKHPPEESKQWNDKLKEIIGMYKLLKNYFNREDPTIE